MGLSVFVSAAGFPTIRSYFRTLRFVAGALRRPVAGFLTARAPLAVVLVADFLAAPFTDVVFVSPFVNSSRRDDAALMIVCRRAMSFLLGAIVTLCFSEVRAAMGDVRTTVKVEAPVPLWD